MLNCRNQWVQHRQLYILQPGKAHYRLWAGSQNSTSMENRYGEAHAPTWLGSAREMAVLVTPAGALSGCSSATPQRQDPARKHTIRNPCARRELQKQRITE